MSYVTTSERQSVLTAEIAAVKTRPAFTQALVRIAEAFGFKYATLMDAPTPESFLLKSLLIESNLPAAYINRFDRARFMQLPMFSTGVASSALPRHWSISDKTTVLPVEFRELKIDFDMRVGISFPSYTADGQRLLFWFSGTRAALGQAEVNELTMIILHAIDAFNLVKSAQTNEHPPLSAREREVVRWTSQGKTSIEIGQILSLSDHTVNAYMTSAIRKLDCVNRTQLVAKAIRYKLIT
ncbi:MULTISPECIES: helix-turn-helix transcriptional regulator [unclassified Rhizobium]|uniref:helix-turn-helix transcriptional regulator n=1 Tax=unclassified Rhizobium TaxID=2613769 RepID=UPI001ADB9693|nr:MULTISPECIES: LuxR family transcriptional regulator [unclassified Rhizobium]MBO9125091.1 autoinducer binding domain-containing protein [Rhizobium sp. 16-488-2b]MBO9175676.1 autoinducer binding domain-containing protein [Rhizobium sp. 16-488-2a]